MRKETDRARQFTRRAFVIGGLQAGLLGVLGGRLAWLQLVQGARYKTLAENNRINVRLLTPSRGEIVDRYGTPLALNTQDFRMLVIPEQSGDLEKSLLAVNKIVPLRPGEMERLLKQARRSASFVPLEIRSKLNWEQVAAVEANLIDLPGVMIDVGDLRHYPLGISTGHLVGYVGAVTSKEIKDDPLLKMPGFRIGKTGLERAHEHSLRGRAGRVEMEANALGREIRELNREPAAQGARITLSIDSELQLYTQKRLSETKSASAVIMDVHSGAVYTLVSHPGFDPNLLIRGISAEQWEELLSDPGFPLNNKAVAGQYPPGSTFKMVTALAALERGIINSKTRVHCPGHYEYGGDRFHCWKWGGHGHMDLVGALAESCDTYFYKISTETGIDNIAKMARRLGLGRKYGFDLPEESPGLIADKAWKLGHFGQSWRPGETIVASIGQGYMQATPLQMAVMTARLVNGGKAVTPWLTAYVGERPGIDAAWPDLKVKPYHLELIRKGMDRAVNHPSGTAIDAAIVPRALAMGGKTGTAQVRRISMQERIEGIQNKDLPWKYRHHALFVGYAPIARPRYACAVVVEHGGSGSTAAAPVARDLLAMAQKRAPADKEVYLDSVTGKAAFPQRKPGTVIEDAKPGGRHG